MKQEGAAPPNGDGARSRASQRGPVRPRGSTIAALDIGATKTCCFIARVEEQPRIIGIGLVFDRLAAPAARQLPAFEARIGRWEELRWSLERLTMRFGEGRLWRAVHDRPSASLAERQARLTEIGLP